MFVLFPGKKRYITFRFQGEAGDYGNDGKDGELGKEASQIYMSLFNNADVINVHDPSNRSKIPYSNRC